MKIKVSLFMIVVALFASIAGIGTYAYFTTQAISEGNVYELGNLEIEHHMNLPLFDRNDGQWYPGREIDEDRSMHIYNKGTLPAKIYGITAEIKEFNKNEVFYDFDGNNEQNIIDAYTDFAENLIVVVEKNGYEYYRGALSGLIQPDSICRLNDFIVLQSGNSTQSYTDLNFSVKMSESAGNDSQGISAKVDLKIHATQTNDNLD